MNGYQRGLLRSQIPLLLLFLAAAGWAGWRLPDFAVEAGTDVLLDQADPDLAYYNQTRADWGSDEYVIVCCHRNEGWFTPASLGLLGDFIRQCRRQPYARKVLSIAGVPLLRNKPAGLFPVPVFLLDPDGNLDPGIDLDKARAELVEHTQARGNLISADGKDLSILVYLDVPEDANSLEAERNRLLGGPRTAESDRRRSEIEGPFQASVQEQGARRGLLVAGLRRLAAAWRPKLDEPVRLSGLPIINVVLREHIKADITTFGAVALSVFTLTFLLIYRRARWVILPILSCILPVALMLGLMVAMGRKTTVITSNMPVLLFVLTLPYAVYYIERYLERRATHPDEDPKFTATRAPVEIWSPCLFSVLATMVGTAAHIPSGIIPVRTFGVLMTIGMGLSLAVIMLFLPATVLALKGVPGAGGATPDRDPPGPLKVLLALVLGAPRAVMIFSLAVLAVSIWGTTKIKVETKFIDYFRAKSEIYQGLDYIDTRMGGTTPFEVILRSPTPGFFKTPEGLAALDTVGSFIGSIEETGNVRSLKTLVDEAKKAFTDRSGKVKAKDAQILGLVASMAKEQVREFANSDFTVSRVLVRMKETAPTLNRNRILGRLREYLRSKKDAELRGVEARPTGVFLLYANMLNTLIRSTKETFVLAVVGIWLMLLVLFRSPILATLVLLPQVLPVLLVLGVMGFFGVALDMVTVIIASVAMGVGIDAAIQYAVRFRNEFERSGGDLRAAIKRSHATIGRAILIATSIVFAGFAMLCFSQFVPTVYFGLFTALAILMGLFASLTTLPASFLLLNYPRKKSGRSSGEGPSSPTPGP